MRNIVGTWTEPFYTGPKDRINIRISHAGSKAQHKGGYQKSSLVGSFYLDTIYTIYYTIYYTMYHIPRFVGSLCLRGLFGVLLYQDRKPRAGLGHNPWLVHGRLISALHGVSPDRWEQRFLLPCSYTGPK